MKAILAVGVSLIALNLAIWPTVSGQFTDPEVLRPVKLQDLTIEMLESPVTPSKLVTEAELWQESLTKHGSHSQELLLKAILAHQCRLELLLMHMDANIEAQTDMMDDEPDSAVTKLVPETWIRELS